MKSLTDSRGILPPNKQKHAGIYDRISTVFLRSGDWVKELRGIYRLTHYPIQERPELVLWSLWSRNKKGEPQGVWSHETALDIHELTDIMPAKMHLSVPKGFRRNQEIPAVLILHRADLKENEIEKRRGYKVTTPLRTLVDVIMADSIALDQIEMGIQDALKQGLISKRQIMQSQAMYPKAIHFFMRHI